MTQPIPSSFNEKKASEVAFFFLSKAKQTAANVTKVRFVKWLYLAERLSYERYGEPLTGDALFSMKHGPVPMETLNLIERPEAAVCEGNLWDQVVVTYKGPEDAHQYIDLASTCPYRSANDLLTLSRADLTLLEDIWKDYGRWSAHRLEKMLHDPELCPEWNWHVGDTRNPIELESLFSALKYSEAEKSAAIEWLHTREALDRALTH